MSIWIQFEKLPLLNASLKMTAASRHCLIGGEVCRGGNEFAGGKEVSAVNNGEKPRMHKGKENEAKRTGQKLRRTKTSQILLAEYPNMR